MTPRNFRIVLAVAIAAAVVLSVAAAVALWIQGKSVEISVTDVELVPDALESGMTEVHVRLVLKNVGPAQADFALVTLFAYDPVHGTLFDTFAHSNFQIDPGETQAFSEATFVTGHWSEVAFTVKVFPNGSPGWERPLAPDQPVTWTVW